MIRQERGFSLVELMVTVVIFIMVIAASSQVFTGLLTQFKQQSKIGETDIEGAIGLDILRRDLAHAGFGLPGILNSWQTYGEAVAESGQTFWTDRDLNDGPPDNPNRGTDAGGNSNPPGAIRSLDNRGIHNADDRPGLPAGPTNAAIAGSFADVLAIKATNVGMSEASQRWTYISNTGALPNRLQSWGTGSQDNFRPGDRVVVMRPNPTGRVNALWSTNGATFWTTFASDITNIDATFQPTANIFESYVMYGVDDGADLRMPFNRADYYVKRPASMPGRCAPRTGILYKSMLKQTDGKHTELPVLDCVADMQVRFCLNTGTAAAPVLAIDDGTIVNNLTAAQLRQQLEDIQVYIVAQEGQRDANYDFSNNNARVRFRPRSFCGTTVSQDFDMVNLSGLVNKDATGAAAAEEYKRYHWRLYTIVQRPTSMR